MPLSTMLTLNVNRAGNSGPADINMLSEAVRNLSGALRKINGRTLRDASAGAALLTASNSRLSKATQQVVRDYLQELTTSSKLNATRQAIIDSRKKEADALKKLSAEYGNAASASRKYQQQMRTMRATALDMSYIFGRLARSAEFMAAGIFGAGVGVAGKAINTHARFEDYRMQLKAVGDLTGEIWEKTRKFALVSPLTFEDSVKGVIRLKQFGEGTDVVFNGLLQTMTKISVISKKPLDQVVGALEALKTGTFRRRELNPMGITPAWLESIGLPWDPKHGKPFALETGNLQDFAKTFDKIMSELAKKYKDYHPETLLRTLIANMGDALDLAFDAIGASFDKFSKPFLTRVQKLILDFGNMFSDPGVQAAIDSFVGMLAEGFGKILTHFENLVAAIQKDPAILTRWLNNMANAFKGLLAVAAGSQLAAFVATIIQLIATVKLAFAAAKTAAGAEGIAALFGIGPEGWAVIAILAAFVVGATAVWFILKKLFPAMGDQKKISQETADAMERLGIKTNDAHTALSKLPAQSKGAAAGLVLVKDAAKNAADELQRVKDLRDGIRAENEKKNPGVLTSMGNAVKGFFSTPGSNNPKLHALAQQITTDDQYVSLADEWQRSQPGKLGHPMSRAQKIQMGKDIYAKAYPQMSPADLARQGDTNRIVIAPPKVGPTTEPVDPAVAKEAARQAAADKKNVGDLLMSSAKNYALATNSACAQTGCGALQALGVPIPTFTTTGEMEKWLNSTAGKQWFTKVNPAKMTGPGIGFSGDFKNTGAGGGKGPNGMPDHVMEIGGVVRGLISATDQSGKIKHPGSGYFKTAYQLKSGLYGTLISGAVPIELTDLQKAGIKYRSAKDDYALMAGIPGFGGGFAAGQKDALNKALADSFMEFFKAGGAYDDPAFAQGRKAFEDANAKKDYEDSLNSSKDVYSQLADRVKDFVDVLKDQVDRLTKLRDKLVDVRDSFMVNMQKALGFDRGADTTQANILNRKLREARDRYVGSPTEENLAGYGEAGNNLLEFVSGIRQNPGKNGKLSVKDQQQNDIANWLMSQLNSNLGSAGFTPDGFAAALEQAQQTVQQKIDQTNSELSIQTNILVNMNLQLASIAARLGAAKVGVTAMAQGIGQKFAIGAGYRGSQVVQQYQAGGGTGNPTDYYPNGEPQIGQGDLATGFETDANGNFIQSPNSNATYTGADDLSGAGTSYGEDTSDKGKAKKGGGIAAALQRTAGIINAINGILTASKDQMGTAIGGFLDTLIPGAGGIFSALGGLFDTLTGKSGKGIVVDRILQPVKTLPQSTSIFGAQNPAGWLWRGSSQIFGAASKVVTELRGDAKHILKQWVEAEHYSDMILGGV